MIQSQGKRIFKHTKEILRSGLGGKERSLSGRQAQVDSPSNANEQVTGQAVTSVSLSLLISIISKLELITPTSKDWLEA